VLSDQRLLNMIRAIGTLLVVLAAIRVSWISDDALITLRTSLNITHGWGPGFNATESVQAFTYPLWFLLWVGIGALTNQWILGLLALGAVLVAVAVALLMWRAISRALLCISDLGSDPRTHLEPLPAMDMQLPSTKCAATVFR
jgi:hypothetical protein